MSFLNTLGLLVGLFTGCLSIYQFAMSRQRRGAVLAITAIGLLVGTLFLVNVPSLFLNKSTDNSVTPTSSSQQPGTSSSPAQAQQSSSPTPIPTTPTPKIDHGYQSDFCNKKNEWASSSGAWTVVENSRGDCALYSSSQGYESIVVPYVPKTPDYRVIITAQVLDPSNCYQGIYIQVRADENSEQGYTGGYTCNSNTDGLTHLGLSPTLDIPTHDYIDWTLRPFSAGGNQFKMSLTVKGTQVILAVNGTVYIDKQYTSVNTPGSILLHAEQTAIKVSNIEVTPL